MIIKPSDSQQKMRTCRIVDFAIPADCRVKLKETEKRDMYLDLAKEQKKYATWKWLRNKRMGGTHQSYSIVEIGQNTETILEDMRWPVVSEEPPATAGVYNSQKRNKNNK